MLFLGSEKKQPFGFSVDSVLLSTCLKITPAKNCRRNEILILIRPRPPKEFGWRAEPNTAYTLPFFGRRGGKQRPFTHGISFRRQLLVGPIFRRLHIKWPEIPGFFWGRLIEWCGEFGANGNFAAPFLLFCLFCFVAPRFQVELRRVCVCRSADVDLRV